MAKRRKRWEVELDRLCALPSSEDEAEPIVVASLASAQGLVVARAAELVRERELRSVCDQMVEAFHRLCADAVKRDPGCMAKLALLNALDHLGHRDDELYLAATRYVQREPAYPRSVDTAGAVRSRGGAALARVGHPSTLLVLATLLADPEPPVRRAAAEALSYHGDVAGAALLVHKIAVGDEDPIVVAEAMTSLLDLDVAWALPLLRERLFGDDAEDQDLVRIVLGQHRRREAVALLIAWFHESVLSADKIKAVDAIAIHRSDTARTFLLERVEDGSAPVARAAVEALAIHRYDERLREQVLDAAGRSSVAKLDEFATKAFAT